MRLACPAQARRLHHNSAKLGHHPATHEFGSFPVYCEARGNSSICMVAEFISCRYQKCNPTTRKSLAGGAFMASKVRIAIIGAGAVADYHHVPGIRIDPRAELVAACDPHEQLLAKRKSDWSISTVTTN